jgi:predicted MFS family arabinose efflux permease
MSTPATSTRHAAPDAALPAGPLWARLLIVQVLAFAVMLPEFFSGALLPTILRERGLALDQLAWLSLTTVPTWFRWAMGPVVDARWSRRRWVIPASALAAAGYIAAGQVDIVGNYALLLGVLTLVNALLLMQLVPAEAYHIESFAERERPYGAIVAILGPILTNVVVFVGLSALYEQAGWQVTAYAAAAILVGCSLPMLVMRERVPVAQRQSLWQQGRPQLRLFFRRAQWPQIAWLVFAFGATQAAVQGLTGPYLIDRGFSVGDVGVLMGSFLTAAIVLGALLAAVLSPRIGLHKVLALAALTQVIGAAALYVLVGLQQASLGTAGALFFVFVLGMMPLVYAMSLSRMSWPSPSQAGTDNAVMATLAAVGGAVGGAAASLAAEHVGYGVTFAAIVVISLSLPLLYLRWFALLGTQRPAEVSADTGPDRSRRD